MRLALAGPITVSTFEADLHPLSAVRAFSISPFGGTAINFLAKALLVRGHRLTIFTLAPNMTQEIVLDGPSLRICVGPLRAKHRAADFFAAERTYLQRAIKRERPEIINAHWTYEFALASMASDVPTIVSAHDAPMNVLRHFRDPYRVARTLMAAQALRRARHLTAVSPHVARHLRDAMGCRRDIQVVPNGYPDEFFSWPARKAESNQPLTFATALNGWSKPKNSRTAIRAFAQLRRQRENVRMIMFGSDHGIAEAAHQWSAKENLSEGIEFAGRVPSEILRKRMAEQVDVFVHPSLEEAHCNSMCEAMSQGIPVIGGHESGGVPWTLEEGAAGLLVNVRSAKDVASAMQTLNDDPALRKQLGDAGRESVARRFHISVIAQAYETEFIKVLKAA